MYMYFWSHLAQCFLEYEMFQTKVVERVKTHILCSITFFFRKKSVVFWDNVERQATYNNTTQRMRITGWIPKATNTHSEYVTPIAFPLKQCLHERALMLRYTHIACLLSIQFVVFLNIWHRFVKCVYAQSFGWTHRSSSDHETRSFIFWVLIRRRNWNVGHDNPTKQSWPQQATCPALC